ncbi:sodium/hydrogen exchanger 9B2-like [Schistocerca gregaria]|uniref:sodium/hydrogen exchanger 9B2-like n=1 Tax=Schistocerca gregaria TaxID=7010 RepID=UPI00211E671D|nr:sodium/hydrogen exchanger 9B2-like [Schistocerca gregaria]
MIATAISNMITSNTSEDLQSVSPWCCPSVTEETVLCRSLRCRHLYNAVMAVVLALMGWAVLFSFSEPGYASPPRGEVFVLYSLLVLSSLMGWIFSKMYLPPALAMMLVGMVYGNMHLFTPGVTISRYLIVNSRLAAITCVLVRAGLALEAKSMKQYQWLIMRLAFLPMFAEMLAVTIATYLLLGFSWLWSAILGSIICAASPAVAVHLILQLTESGYGIDKDIKTITVAAISLDSVTAIVVIDFLLTFQYSQGAFGDLMKRGPVQILIGLVVGVAYGVFLSFFPHKYYKKVYFYRILFLCSGAVSFILGSRKLHCDPAGYFACLMSTFIASQSWQRNDSNENQNPANDVMKFLWKCLQPVLFGLIGAEFNFELIDADMMKKGIAILFIGILFRLSVAYMSSIGIGLSRKEKIFMTISWIPKATVQAAFGPLVLDLMLHIDASEEDKLTATTISIVSAVSVLLFGSIGTVGIMLGGRHLLQKSEQLESVSPSSLYTQPTSSDQQRANTSV